MKSYKNDQSNFFKKIIFKRKNYILSFVFTWIVYTFFLLTSGYNIFYNDAWAYWDYGTKMFIGNHFSLLNYGDASRGVLFPFLNSILVLVSHYLNVDGLIIFKILSAFITSFICCFLFPETIYRLTGKAASIGNIMLFNAFTLFFWGDYLIILYLISLLYFLSYFVFIFLFDQLFLINYIWYQYRINNKHMPNLYYFRIAISWHLFYSSSKNTDLLFKKLYIYFYFLFYQITSAINYQYKNLE